MNHTCIVINIDNRLPYAIYDFIQVFVNSVIVYWTLYYPQIEAGIQVAINHCDQVIVEKIAPFVMQHVYPNAVIFYNKISTKIGGMDETFIMGLAGASFLVLIYMIAKTISHM